MSDTLWSDPDHLGADIQLYERQVEESGISPDTPAYSRLLGYATRARAAYGSSEWQDVRTELQAGRAEIQALQDKLRVPVSVSSSRQPQPTPATTTLPTGGPSRRHWELWLLWLIIPLAFVARLYLTGGSDFSSSPPADVQTALPTGGNLPAAGPAHDSLADLEVLQMAGLPQSYQFMNTSSNTTLSELPPHQVAWTVPWEFDQ